MKIIDLKSSAGVIAYINTLQGIINRLANNSTQCKTWCITLTAGLWALNSKEICVPKYVLLIIVSMFFLLDSFYLGQEREIRKIMNSFVQKLNEGIEDEISKMIFDIKTLHNRPSRQNLCPIEVWGNHFCSQFKSTLWGLFSFSTLPFYVILMSLVYFFIS